MSFLQERLTLSCMQDSGSEVRTYFSRHFTKNNIYKNISLQTNPAAGISRLRPHCQEGGYRGGGGQFNYLKRKTF